MIKWSFDLQQYSTSYNIERVADFFIPSARAAPLLRVKRLMPDKKESKAELQEGRGALNGERGKCTSSFRSKHKSELGNDDKREKKL